MTFPNLVIITGASSGIGAAIAKRFSQANHSLALIARNIEALNSLNLPNSLCYKADVTDATAIQTSITDAQSRLGPCAALINSAGFIKTGPFHEVAQEDHAAMISTNVMGVINPTLAVLPGMMERRNGSIINISSTADRQPRPHIATYAASKAAIKSLTESLRADNAAYGVRIAMLTPAKVATPMLLNSDLSKDDLIQPEHVAETAYWMFQQPSHICIRDIVIAPTGFVP